MSFVALLAVAFFLLGPVCAGLHAANAFAEDQVHAGLMHNDSGAELCCASLSDASMLPAGTAPAFGAGTAGELAAPVAFAARTFVPTASALTRDPPRSPPRSQPYHARTARILA